MRKAEQMKKKIFSAAAGALTVNVASLGLMAARAYAWSIPQIIATVPNPCDLVNQIATFLVTVAIGVSVIFIAIGGIQYMNSGGDKMAIENARGKVTGAIIGAVIAVGAYAILRFVVETVLRGNIEACSTPY